MIKAIIADVDGVMVGNKHGVNFPLPNENVIKKLKELHQNGFPIILCTAKYHPGIIEIIKKANLHNPHITSGGALIIDPLDNKVIKKHTLNNELADKIITTCIENNVYIECYGIEDYYVQQDQACDVTEKHALVNQIEPKLISSLKEGLKSSNIIKIEAFAKDKDDCKRVDSLIQKFSDGINMRWTTHPTILPFQICVLTAKGISKKAETIELLNYIKVSPHEALGIGDALVDWDFMEICKYVATVGNESSELKELVKTKGEGNYYFGLSVDEDGILDIFNYFEVS